MKFRKEAVIALGASTIFLISLLRQPKDEEWFFWQLPGVPLIFLLTYVGLRMVTEPTAYTSKKYTKENIIRKGYFALAVSTSLLALTIFVMVLYLNP